MQIPNKSDSFRVVAIVSAFNEADIISPVIEHLVQNGVDVYLIDNHSTDGTAEEARRWLRKGLIGIEQFPADRPAGEGPPPFDWEAILRRKEELAKELSADWFIHHDADEFREAPWPGMNLRDAIRWVDCLGYNCIDFRVLNFPPLGNGFEPGAPPERAFTHWEDPVVYDTLQRKAWKAQKTPVSLAASGGHEARFPGRRVFPIRFLLRHYPIRSQEHGMRKVFDERRKRFVEKERAKGWHVQYDSIGESHSFLRDPEGLHPYDPDRVRLDLMLENESTREAEGRARELAAAAEAHQKTLEAAQRELAASLGEREAQVSNLKMELAEVRRRASGLEHERETFAAHARETEIHSANLQSRIAELERHASGLENDRKTLAAHIAHLEAVRVGQDSHVARLEELRAAREAEAASAAAKLAELERHAAGLEKDRETLAAHISHLDAVLHEETFAHAELVGRNLENQSRAELLEARSRDLEDRFTTLRNQMNRVEGLRQEAEDRAARAERELTAMRQSTFWRMTAPVRWALDQLKELFR
ncbi:MAG TPA: glycosyltransferase family 2 protein [Thermoanaerobaculia bacterium]